MSASSPVTITSMVSPFAAPSIISPRIEPPAAEIKKWYVSKIATWVDKQTLLPVQRDFYSPNGQVFKIETFDNVKRVDGVPTPFQITMQNVGADTKSVLKVTDVTYGSGLPDNLFEPKELPQIADVLEKTGSIKPK